MAGSTGGLADASMGTRIAQMAVRIEPGGLKMPCVCGLEPGTEECCGRFLSGEQRPESAEQLMRSRYAAFVLGNVDYIMETHDPETVGSQDRSFVEKWSQESKWDGFDVLASERGGSEDTDGVVEFVAKYRMGGQSARHHERATFRKIEGRWYFSDGELVKPKTMVREQPKVGRNDPCSCGSGVKYKKCHGRR